MTVIEEKWTASEHGNLLFKSMSDEEIRQCFQGIDISSDGKHIDHVGAMNVVVKLEQLGEYTEPPVLKERLALVLAAPQMARALQRFVRAEQAWLKAKAPMETLQPGVFDDPLTRALADAIAALESAKVPL